MNKKISKIILKKNKKKIVSLTAYSKNIAKILDKYVDIILVGDSMANVLYGHKNTHQISLQNIIQHTLSVKLGVRKSLLVVDMPKGSYDNLKEAKKNAKLIITKTKCDAIKIENRKKKDISIIEKQLNEKKLEIENQKTSKIQELKQSFEKDANSRSEREAARILEGGKLDAKKILFDAINKNLDSTFDVIKKELDGYSKKPEYNQVLQKLVDYSKKVLAKEIVVRCREEDKSFFKSGVKVGSTIQTLGGFIAENKEGTKEIDLTFEELLRNNEDEIKNTILEKVL